jgi:hypothetical protein
MHIEPVIPEFHSVTIRRSGGIMGLNETLHIDEDLHATVRDRRRGDRSVQLDAYTSQELMTALATLVERAPKASTATGYDLFNYDVELAWNGHTYRISSVDLGADEALHGVMLAAGKLIERDPDPFHVMSLHTLAHVE